MISGFHSEVVENCILLGYFAVCSGNSLPAFLEPISWNIGKELPLLV